MTIIYQQGQVFWIEVHAVPIILSDAAGAYSSAPINMDREGNCVGVMYANQSLGSLGDNAQALAGGMQIRRVTGLANWTIGLKMADFLCRVVKTVGTEGDITTIFQVTFFMKAGR